MFLWLHPISSGCKLGDLGKKSVETKGPIPIVSFWPLPTSFQGHLNLIRMKLDEAKGTAPLK